MKVAHKTDVGKRREGNEDYLLVDGDRNLFLLADGMGGHQAGEVASEMAVREAHAYIAQALGEKENQDRVSKTLSKALFKAHDAILEKAKTDLALTGMGTTLVVLAIEDNQAFICHVGDSRAYLLRDAIEQITEDHTVGTYLVKQGIMTREKVPPQKWHTLTQALGASPDLVPEIHQMDLKEGDTLLLCSDGLTDMLSDQEILEIVKKYNSNVEKAANALVKAANKHGGRDNISIVLVRI
jgi:PPM family protein phosphatase